jgi:MYXO-CTERM domain-containing protein
MEATQMTKKITLSMAALAALVLSAAPAFADVPMPECVDNPACQSSGGCSVSDAPGAATAGVGVFALGAAALLLSRRRKV